MLADMPSDGSGGIWLDVSGCAHLFGGEAALLNDLIARLGRAGHAARAGLAETPEAAWAIARFGERDAPWTAVPAGGLRTALSPLSVAALGIGPEAVSRLDALGIRRIGALAGLPRAGLARRFGPGLVDRLDAALGRRESPISPDRPVAPHFARLGFAEPIGRAEDIAAGLDRMLGQLCEGLARRGHGARRLVLSLFEPAGAVHRFAVGTSRPSRAAGHLAALFATPLADLETAFGIETMTLTATETEPLGPAQMMLTRAHAETGDADAEAGALVDRLANRLGPARVLRLHARESHLPERAVVARTALDGGAVPDPSPAWPIGPRPLRLFARPEPIEAVAPVPDDPPVMFRWRRVLRRVRRAEGPERIAPEWWRAPEAAGTASDTAALRDYYRVEDTEGRRYWLYREGLYDPAAPPAWFLHGLFG